MNHDIKIIDNFLSDVEFDICKRMCLHESVAWYWYDYVNEVGDGKSQLAHIIWYNQPLSSIFEGLNGLSHKFPGFKSWRRIKMNANPRTTFKRNQGFHVDYQGIRTAIFYVNTTNGGTKFKGGPFVKGIENRLVVFKSDLLHAGITCTDQPRKVAINFNYFFEGSL